MTPVPCPSWGAYKRHLRAGETCRDCLAFVAAVEQARRDRRKAEMVRRAG